MRILSTLLMLCIATLLTAQKEWTLEECIQYAWENSLETQSAEMDVQSAENNLRASKLNRIPDLSASSTFSRSYGRSLDPTTDGFVNQSFSNQNVSVSGGILLFNGNRISNNIKSNMLSESASKQDLIQSRNDVALVVAQNFLAVLLAEDNLNIARENLALTEAQIAQTEKFIEAGTRAKNEVLDLLATAASNEESIILSQNEQDIAYLNLRNSMNYISDEAFVISRPEDSDLNADDVLDGQAILQQALDWSPALKALDLRTQSADLGVSISRAAFLPSLSIGGSLGTSFSSAAMTASLTGTQLRPQDGVFINGESVNFAVEEPTFDLSETSYGDQLNENLGYGFGLTLSVPIFSQGNARNRLEESKLNVLRAKLQKDQFANRLRLDVETAIAAANAAKQSYEAAERTLSARDAAFNDAQKRYEIGVANSLDLSTAQQNLKNAQLNANRTYYDMLFKNKIVDYYLGREIKLD